MQMVKYNNELNKIKTTTLTESELNLFVGLIFKFQNLDNLELQIKFSELRELIDSKSRSTQRMIENYDKLTDKLMTLNETVRSGNGDFLKFQLFNDMKTDISKSILTVNMNQNFAYMIKDIKKFFTTYSLKQFILLESKYSKVIFKNLQQYKSTGWLELKIDDFNDLLGTHKYSTANMNKAVFKKLDKELSEIFDNFEIIKLDKNKKKATRTKIEYIKFIWDPIVKLSKSENIQNKKEKDRIKADEKAKVRIAKTEKSIEDKSNKKTSEISIEEMIYNSKINNIPFKFLPPLIKITEEEYNNFNTDLYLEKITTVEEVEELEGTPEILGGTPEVTELDYNEVLFLNNPLTRDMSISNHCNKGNISEMNALVIADGFEPFNPKVDGSLADKYKAFRTLYAKTEKYCKKYNKWKDKINRSEHITHDKFQTNLRILNDKMQNIINEYKIIL